MELTYGVGPNKTKYCKFKAKNSEFIYDIDGIRKGKRFKHEQRRELIINIIARNLISHNHLLHLAAALGKIAKKTTVKILKELEDDRLIESEQKGISSNSIKIWMIKSPESEIEKHAKKEAQNIIAGLEEYIQTIEKKFEKLNNVQKDYAMANLLDILHSWQPIIEIVHQDTRIKNEKRKFDSLVKRAYDILKYEKRDGIDTRPFLRRLLDLKASEPMVIMNNYLEEIK